MYLEGAQQAASTTSAAAGALSPQPGAVYMAGLNTGSGANMTSLDVAKMEQLLWDAVTIDMQGQVLHVCVCMYVCMYVCLCVVV
jgi:hypothetical protein